MADLYRMFIKSEDGKTREVFGTKDQHGNWIDREGSRYFSGPDAPPQAEKQGKNGPEKWTLLDTARTSEKVGK